MDARLGSQLPEEEVSSDPGSLCPPTVPVIGKVLSPCVTQCSLSAKWEHISFSLQWQKQLKERFVGEYSPWQITWFLWWFVQAAPVDSQVSMLGHREWHY